MVVPDILIVFLAICVGIVILGVIGELIITGLLYLCGLFFVLIAVIISVVADSFYSIFRK